MTEIYIILSYLILSQIKNPFLLYTNDFFFPLILHSYFILTVFCYCFVFFTFSLNKHIQIYLHILLIHEAIPITCFAKCFVCVYKCCLYLCACPRVALHNVLSMRVCVIYIYVFVLRLLFSPF